MAEAKQSSNAKGYYKGYSIQITSRDPDLDALPLLDQMIKVVDEMVERGFEPSWNTDTNKKLTPSQDTRFVPTPPEKTLTATCRQHQDADGNDIVMDKVEGKYGTFWSHYKEESGRRIYCNGKGWK